MNMSMFGSVAFASGAWVGSCRFLTWFACSWRISELLLKVRVQHNTEACD